MVSAPIDEKPAGRTWGETGMRHGLVRRALGKMVLGVVGKSPGQRGLAWSRWTPRAGHSYQRPGAPAGVAWLVPAGGAGPGGGRSPQRGPGDLTSEGACMARSLRAFNSSPFSIYRNGRIETNNKDEPVSSVF